jgi:hypothetical protein
MHICLWWPAGQQDNNAILARPGYPNPEACIVFAPHTADIWLRQTEAFHKRRLPWYIFTGPDLQSANIMRICAGYHRPAMHYLPAYTQAHRVASFVNATGLAGGSALAYHGGPTSWQATRTCHSDCRNYFLRGPLGVFFTYGWRLLKSTRRFIDSLSYRRCNLHEYVCLSTPHHTAKPPTQQFINVSQCGEKLRAVVCACDGW